MTANVTGQATPRVVIVDVDAWDAFRELAAALRQNGVDVVHLRPAYRGRLRAVKRAVDTVGGPVLPLDRPITDDDPESAALRRRILAAPTVDVHAPEPVLDALARTPEWLANPALRKVRDEVPLHHVLDKWDVAQIARAAGVALPAASLELAADRFPVVVKGRLGAGGTHVRIARTQTDVDSAAESFRRDGVEPYLERFHPHRLGVATAGVADRGTMLTCGTFERRVSPEQPLAAAVEIRAYDDDAAVAATERLIAAIGYTGMFCLNFVPDDDGTHLLIDVNLRAFGAWVTLDELGVPLLAAYLELIGAGPAAPPLSLDGSRWRGVVRVGVDAHGSLRDVARITRKDGALVWRRRRSLGWGWTAATGLRVLQAGTAGAIERRGPTRAP